MAKIGRVLAVVCLMAIVAVALWGWFMAAVAMWQSIGAWSLLVWGGLALIVAATHRWGV